MHSVAPEMEDVFVKLRRVARGDWTVLLVGETGTGKELAAAAIHAESRRASGPFREVNCATFSPTLLESELFGHVRGAFTGAIRDNPGLLRSAHRGTLLLDEVSEIPLDLQGKMLRVIQEKTFVPVGGTIPVRVDVRIISASNRSIQDEVAAGRFRADLAFRLRVVPIHLPPLRARTGDVAALFWHFLAELNSAGPRRISAVERDVLVRLRRHPWPGNVRELRSAIEYAFALGEGPLLATADLPPEFRGEAPWSPRTPGSGSEPEPPERSRIRAALARHKGRKGEAAAALGISRQTLWRKLSIYGLR